MKYFFSVLAFTRVVVASTQIDLNNWLSEYPETMKVSEIPILPGSHNSGSSRSRLSVGIYQIARQQKMSIKRQLESGIRVVDLRIRYDTKPVSKFVFGQAATKPVIRVVHTLDTKYTLKQALGEIDAFLAKNDSEFVVILLRGDWPPESSFSPKETKRERVRQLADLLSDSGIDFASNVNKDSTTIGDVRGKAILVSQWFQEDPATRSNVDIVDSEGIVIPYVNWNGNYQVCDIWDDNFDEKISLKVDRFMRSTQEKNVGVIERVGNKPRVCDALPGSRLFTGVALDRTHGFIIPPGLTSNSWTNWFIRELETNPEWRPSMSPAVPVGIVLFDFADARYVERLVKVGRKMIQA